MQVQGTLWHCNLDNVGCLTQQDRAACFCDMPTLLAVMPLLALMCCDCSDHAAVVLVKVMNPCAMQMYTGMTLLQQQFVLCFSAVL
jgi:hypothetical protein